MIVEEKLILNSEKRNLLNEISRSILECERFYFSEAFINFRGLQLLLDSFKEAEKRSIKGKIITSTYLNFTEAKALRKYKGFCNKQGNQVSYKSYTINLHSLKIFTI